MYFQERYTPVLLATDATYDLNAVSGIGGFIAVTAGTFSVYKKKFDGTLEVCLQNFPVSAGTSYKMPISLPAHGGAIILSGGASGTLLTF